MADYKHENRIKEFFNTQNVPQRFAPFVFGKPKDRKCVLQEVRRNFLYWADEYIDVNALLNRPDFARSVAFGIHNHLVGNKEISNTFLGYISRAVRDTKEYKQTQIQEIIQATRIDEYMRDKTRK